MSPIPLSRDERVLTGLLSRSFRCAGFSASRSMEVRDATPVMLAVICVAYCVLPLRAGLGHRKRWRSQNTGQRYGLLRGSVRRISCSLTFVVHSRACGFTAPVKGTFEAITFAALEKDWKKRYVPHRVVNPPPLF